MKRNTTVEGRQGLVEEKANADPLLTVRQVAARLGCSAATVYQMIAAKVLAHFRVRTSTASRRAAIRVSEAQLAAYLARQEEGEKEPVKAPPPPPRPTPKLRLEDVTL
jgi:excisionase family DNA binding protein